ncbi:MAG: response regulator [Lachnospiraceae bacterium]|nr:response regulator [Lachnospiraceae bacterium]
MLKVFLAEDEFIVRQGIKNKIAWESLGLDFCGEAADGEMALESVRKLKPDILITDIRMPFMDGLELCHHVREEFPDTEILILSGFTDFEYVREGLKLGVSEYLTKPIKPEELTEAIKTLIEKINKRTAEDEERRQSIMRREEELMRYFKETLMAEKREEVSAPEAKLDIKDIDIKQIDRGRLEEFLKMGDAEESDDFIDEVFGALNPRVLDSMLFRQYVLMDSYFAVCEFVESLGMDKTTVEQPGLSAGVMVSREEAISYMKRVTKNALELRESTAGSKQRDVANAMRDFVAENYSNSALSLNSVAEHIGFSPNYLSMVFSQQEGVTFIKYITDYRIAKAKELLKCTNKRSSEISELVGYSDPHYFSYTFKKATGVTPSQYRSGDKG